MTSMTTKEEEERIYKDQKEIDEKEIEVARVAASLLHPTYSREWYLELDKCPAVQRQQAAFWKKYGSSKGW
jgi:hypothetical protein